MNAPREARDPSRRRSSDERATSAFATRGSLREIRTRIRRQWIRQYRSSFFSLFPYPFSNDNSCQVESRLYHFSAGSLPSFFSLSMPRVPFSRADQCDTVLSIHSQYGGLARRWNMEIGMFRIILGLGFGGCSNFDGYFDRRGIFRK